MYLQLISVKKYLYVVWVYKRYGIKTLYQFNFVWVYNSADIYVYLCINCKCVFD